MQRLFGKRIVLGVGGGIAAYKSAELVRRLRDQGAEVHVVMTRGRNLQCETRVPLSADISQVRRWFLLYGVGGIGDVRERDAVAQDLHQLGE